MNGILFAAASLGAIAAMLMAQPKVDADQPRAAEVAAPAQLASLSFPKSQVHTSDDVEVAKAMKAAPDKGSMTTETIIETDAKGDEVLTEQRVIAFGD